MVGDNESVYCVLWDWFETDRQQTNASIHYICGENSPVAPKEVQFRWPKRLLNSPRNFSTRVSVVSLLRDALRWDVDYTSTWLPFFATCKKSAVIVFYRCKDMNPCNLWTLSLYVQSRLMLHTYTDYVHVTNRCRTIVTGKNVIGRGVSLSVRVVHVTECAASGPSSLHPSHTHRSPTCTDAKTWDQDIRATITLTFEIVGGARSINAIIMSAWQIDYIAQFNYVRTW